MFMLTRLRTLVCSLSMHVLASNRLLEGINAVVLNFKQTYQS